MNKALKPYQPFFYQLIAVGGGVLLLLITLLRFPPSIEIGIGLIIILFVAILVNLPIRLLRSEITLIQAVTLGVGMLFGPTLTAWEVTLGIIAGSLFRHYWSSVRFQRSYSRHSLILDIGYAIGMQIIPLTLTLSAFELQSGMVLDPSDILLGEALSLAIVFVLIHITLFLVDYLLRGSPETATPQRDLISLGLVEVLPLPFVLLAVLTFPDTQIGAWLALGGVPAILAVLMYGISTTRSDLERRLRDLSTLHRISLTLRSTLDMENLLSTIQGQVTQLLGVNNFYVALYDEDDEHLWYPLAVKHGERQGWPRRPLTDRLTDRVLREQEPILLEREAQQELSRIGLPPSEDAPYAWLGVPLITPARTIGCLAVFSTSPDVEFTPADLNLLTTLSGQVSVALDNALLFEQSKQRATELETLNRISSVMTASLDLEKVLSQVCQSVNEVGGGNRSAIYLTDFERNEARLAHTQGLSESFIKNNQTFPVNDQVRTQSLHTGRPELISDLSALQDEIPFVVDLQQENIQAYGDFPLITLEGPIGFLSVYFDRQHEFDPKQVELLQTFASQAALAVSNARLYARTDMALSRRVQQLAYLENIGRELGAAIHSERLFEMILDYALEFTNSPWGSLNLFDPSANLIEIKASRGYSLQKNHHPATVGIAGRVIQTQQPVNIGEVANDPDYLDLTGGVAKSQLSVPLAHEERVLGVLTIESPENDAFDGGDQAFLSQLATQAAIAVINADLYRETRQRLREQASLYLVSQRLVGNLNLKNVLENIAQAIRASLEGIAVGAYLWERNQKAYLLQSQVGDVNSLNNPLPARIGENGWTPHQPAQLSGETMAAVLHSGDHHDTNLGASQDVQAIIFPLSIADQRLGLVVAYLPKKRTLVENDLQLPQAMAAQGAIAIQNAMLFYDLTVGRDRLEAVLNSVDDGVLMIDADGNVLLGNAQIEHFMGVKLAEFHDKPLSAFPQPALDALGVTPGEAKDLVENLVQIRHSLPEKVTIKSSGDKLVRVHERFTAPVWSQDRRIIGWVFVVRDVSEEYQLDQARDLITETLVHDLRSPLGAVQSALILLEEGMQDRDQDDISRQSLDIADRSARRAMNLIESLLDISRMESGKIELVLSPVDLHNITSDILGEFLPQAHDHGILLRSEVPAGLPRIHADADKMTRVLANLLDNALKFTPEGGQVVVSAELHENETISVHVSDTGPGIPEEYREKIFERFSQIPNAGGRRRGSGLGLTFCRLAVEAHGGHIWAESRPEGGSVFTFSLPVMAPPPE